jgi:error-prone DNA polymerase
VIVSPTLYDRERLVVRGEPFVVIGGVLQKQHDTINIIAGSIRPMEDARQRFAAVPARELDDIEPRFEWERKQEREKERELAMVAPESHNYR